ncbi:MAG: hypothetical protein MUE42_06730 [Opitutaceae bacterium]|nr:hypothetical protein [Opitutaceae bacterium]
MPAPALRRLLLPFACLLASLAPAQEISPLLVGNNLWYAEIGKAAEQPSAEVMQFAGQAGIRLIRIGGGSFNHNPPGDDALLVWVDRIRALGAEPLIQVSQYAPVSRAESAVRHINLTHRRGVRYWSIGNEPWLEANQDADAARLPRPTEAQMAAAIEAYFKPRAAAMKAVDPSIKIFGVDSEDFQQGLHERLFGGVNNIAGRVPGRDYHYCDGLSWHRYPQADNIDPAWEGLADIRSRIDQCVARVAAANTALGRSGDQALLWAIGEFNSKHGATVHTWGNGQMFAGVYGLAMRHRALFASAWSLRESQHDLRGPTDFSLFDGDTPRPSYWHTQLVARHFTGRYLEGSPSIADDRSPLLVYAAVDDARDRLSVMLINRGGDAAPYTLHLNSANRLAPAGRVALRVDAGRTETHSDTLAARSTQVLVFTRHTLTRIAYSEADFTASPPRGPDVSHAPLPLASTLDAFDAPAGLADTPYWTPLTLNGGQPSTASGRLVLRTSPAAFSTAAIAGQLSSEFNFFDRGFTIALHGLAHSSPGTPAEAAQFRLALNSSVSRPFRADDSLALRLTAGEARLGFKINQPDTQPDARAGSSPLPAALEIVPLPGAVESAHLSLEPAPLPPGSTDDTRTIRYALRLDGAFGRILRAGSFTAPRSAWGPYADSCLVLEARRDTPLEGAPGDHVETRLATVTRQPALLDDFRAYETFADQTWWRRETAGGARSAVTLTDGAATLLARDDAHAAALLAGPVSPELNFFERPLTLEVRDLALLATPDLSSDTAVFRLSLSSTAERSFLAPDALALRLSGDQLHLGFKLDQPSVNAERVGGPPSASSPLVDDRLPAPATGLLLTLLPAPSAPPAATPITYVLRVTGATYARTYAGSFTADRTRWGPAGASSLVLEARRNVGFARPGSWQQASIGALALRTAPEDLFTPAPRYATWLLRAFSPADLLSPAIHAPDAAPAGDGIPNLLKYALGLPPRAPLPPAALPEAVFTPHEGLALAHSRRTGSELVYTVEASTDLVDWTTPVADHSRSDGPPGWVEVVTRALPPAHADRVFLRLRVAMP